MIASENFRAAFDRMARSDDGHTVYLYLQKRLMEICPVESALQIDLGERRFAAHLMGLMAKGISESGGSNTSSDGGGSVTPDQPIVFAVPEPVSTGTRRGAGRRITADTRTGYDAPDGE